MNENISAKKVFIYANTCTRRRLDAKKIRKYFIENKFKIVNDPKNADYTIFVTCGFLNNIADKSLNLINEFKKYKGELIVAGCLPDISQERLNKVFNGKIITTKNLEKIDELFPENKVSFLDIDDSHILWRNFNPFGINYEPIDLIKKFLEKSIIIKKVYVSIKENIIKKIFGKTTPFNALYSEEFLDAPIDNSYFLLISRGCIHNCSYCAIKKSVGSLKSKPLEECIKEFKEGLENGYNYFILDADDIGHYGFDINSNLVELLDKLTQINGEYSIRLQNTHPKWIIKYEKDLEEIFKRKKIKNIILSIQSGSNKILKLMKRSYKKDELIYTIKEFQRADPDLKIDSHFMIGFPGETEEDFEETIDFLRKIRFNLGDVFLYSDVDGTEANLMGGKVSYKEIQKRTKIMLKFLKNNGYFVSYTGNSISFQDKS